MASIKARQRQARTYADITRSLANIIGKIGKLPYPFRRKLHMHDSPAPARPIWPSTPSFHRLTVSRKPLSQFISTGCRGGANRPSYLYRRCRSRIDRRRRLSYTRIYTHTHAPLPKPQSTHTAMADRHRHRDHHRTDRSNDRGDRDRSGVDAARQLLEEQRGAFKSGGAALASARAAGIGFVYDEDQGGQLTEFEKQQREERVICPYLGSLTAGSKGGRPCISDAIPTPTYMSRLTARGRYPRQARE